MYSSDIEVYGVLVGVRLGIISIVGRLNGFCSVIVYMLIWPFIFTYMGWLDKIVSRLKINESVKKILVLVIVISFSVPLLVLLYLLGITYSFRLISVVILRVYAFVIVVLRIWLTLMIYPTLSLLINLNYKLIILGLMPLPVFFVKVCGNWVLLYFIILLSLLIFL